jgi:hypothetical protein
MQLLQKSELLQKAKKAVGSTSQYAKIPASVLEMTDDGVNVTSSKRATLEKYLLGDGKLDPNDIDKLIENHNLDIIHTLSRRKDLTPAQSAKILNDPVPFQNAGGSINRNDKEAVEAYFAGLKKPENYTDEQWKDSVAYKRKEVESYNISVHAKASGIGRKNAIARTHEIIGNMWANFSVHANGKEEALKTLPERAVSKLFSQSGRVVIEPEHLMHMITERPDLSPALVEKIVQHPNFQSGHFTELMNRREPHVLTRVMRTLGSGNSHLITPRVIGNAMQTPEGRKAVFGNTSIELTPQQLIQGLSDPEVRNSVVRRVANMSNKPGQKELMDHVLAAPLDSEDIGQITSGMANYKYRTSDYYNLTPEQASSLADHAMRVSTPDETGILKDVLSHDRMAKYIPDEKHQQALLHMANNSNETYYIDRTIDHAVGEGKNVLTPEFIHTLLQSRNLIHFASDSTLKERYTPEHLRYLHQRMIEEPAGPAEALTGTSLKSIVPGILASNGETPPELLSSVLNENAHQLPRDIQQSLIDNPNSPRDVWTKLGFESTDPEMRIRASKNIAMAQPDDVTRGLQDSEPSVRIAWMKNAASLTPEHWEVIKKDRSPKLRALASKRADLPADVLGHFVAKDKSLAVNQAALKHPGMTEELMNSAVNKMKVDALLEGVASHRLSSEQLATVHKRIVEAHVASLARIHAKAQKEGIAPENTAYEVGKINTEHKGRLSTMLRHVNLPASSISSILTGLNDSDVQKDDIVQKIAELPNATPEHWANLFNRANMPADFTSSLIAKSPHMTEDQWKNASERVTPAAFERNYYGNRGDGHLLQSILSNPKAPDSVITGLVDKFGHQATRFMANYYGEHRDSIFSEPVLHKIFDALHLPEEGVEDPYINYDTTKAVNALASNDNTPSSLLEKIFSSYANNEELQRKAVNHTNTPDRLVLLGMQSQHPGVKKVASAKMALVDPDATTASLGGNAVVSHPAVEKLKHLKGMVEAHGGSIAKRDLPDKGKSIPGTLLDGRGMLTTQAIESMISGLPKENYGVTWGKWSGCQRHDNSVPQQVLQVNLTNQHINAMKDQGLWDSFQRLHKRAYTDAHPAHRHTLGWARIDAGHPDHWHIDEIQSDIGSRIIREMEKLKESASNGPLSEEDQKYAADLKPIYKLISGPFKSPNHAIFAATHQVARDTGIKQTSMDTLKDQAIQSGMRVSMQVSANDLERYYADKNSMRDETREAVHGWAMKNEVHDTPELGRDTWKEQFGTNNATLDIPVPGFMQHTYKQLPEDVGYTDSPKKEAMPNTNAAEETVQFRKLTKSLSRLQLLVRMLKELNE